jgi:3-oxoacyl-[acyl-carrier-protein] synthase-3
MNGSEVFNFSISEEPRAVREVVAFAGLDLSEIDYFVFHQANRYILSSIAKRLKLDVAKVPMGTVERFGNQSSASIPCALCGELGATLTGTSEEKVLLSGFGVGLSWASAIVDLRKLEICRLVDYRL